MATAKRLAIKGKALIDGNGGPALSAGGAPEMCR